MNIPRTDATGVGPRPVRAICRLRRETAKTPRIAALFFATALTSYFAAHGQSIAGAAGDRLEFMKDSAGSYRITTSDDRALTLKLQEKPVFRLGKQYAEDIVDGAIFLWTGDNGRPEAAIQLFLIKNAKEPQGLWIHEFTSLARSGLTAMRNGRLWWSPTTPGLEFKPVPGAPKPAESAAERNRQRRSLADNFHASDNFGARGWSELRLLPTPIARYGDSAGKLIDGALFSFVLGTDPEVFLFIEAQMDKERSQWQWHYALAPMTVFAVKGSYRGNTVWELPDRHSSWDPSKPFFDKAEGR
jgi:hypothetical protein